MGQRGPKAKKMTDAEFWANVTPINDMVSCWLWQGKTDVSGYGRVRSECRSIPAHRWIALHYKLMNGETLLNLYDPRFVRHRKSCTSKLCCRPDHLFLANSGDGRPIIPPITQATQL